LFDCLFLFFEGGWPHEDDAVKEFFVVGFDLFEAVRAKAAFGVDVDDFFAKACRFECGDECEVGFACACRAKEGGDRVCFKAAG